MRKSGKAFLCLILAAIIAVSGCQQSVVVQNGDILFPEDTVKASEDFLYDEPEITEAETDVDDNTMLPAESDVFSDEDIITPENTPQPAETTAPAEYGAGASKTTAKTTAKTTKKTTAETTAKKSSTKKTTTTAKRTKETIKATAHVSGYRGGKSYPAIKHDLKYMRKLNTDFIGWLTIKDTPIDVPVVQATDNKFYLEHDFYGRYDYTKVGTTFADCHVPLTKTNRPDNLVIYGHNIRTGVGLAKITNYYPNRYGSLDFYLKHPTIKYESVFGGESTYVVFAGMYVNTMTKHGDVFNYYKYRNFNSKNTFYKYFEAVFDRSVFYNPAVNIAYGDEFLTLSTCYYPMGMDVDTRFVLFARKLRKGESAKIDVSKAYINKSPLYFKYYYKVNGGKWAGRKWSKSLMQGYSKWLKEQDAKKTSSSDKSSTKDTTAKTII